MTDRIENEHGMPFVDLHEWMTRQTPGQKNHVWLRVNKWLINVTSAEIDAEGCLIFGVEEDVLPQVLRD